MSNGTGRSAIITGAAQGIGRGIALRLAADGFGATVVDLPAAVESMSRGRVRG